ncbi:MAG: pseudouridine synthase [Treponema sp.]|uniref:RluA family pseudouridine synthase n=1 Tax=Treponema sp. TaxID=166 RepID=UPI002A909D4A|nr:pseudouridine synthase [Treponema sp.]MDY6396524.1 pseudouridine synthase [Treponema sp.]
MFPPFPQEKAAKILEELILSLQNGEIELVQIARPSEERKNQGVMLGALVCKDKNGNEVKLVTNSGNAKKLKVESGKRKTENDFFGEVVFAGAIVSAEEIEDALSENDKEIHELTEQINNEQLAISSEQLKELRKQREKLCSLSLEKVHDLYKFHCIDGKIRSLKEICEMYNGGKLPPTGTGDCCAPKLLDYAFSHELMPISLAETEYTARRGNDCSTAEGVPLAVWSDSGSAESVTAKPDRPEEQGRAKQCPEKNFPLSTFHFPLTPPCDERCGILLPAMLGLRILWRDEAICVVNKQSGLLSVPGRGEDKQDCIESRFRQLFGDKVEIKQPAVHRLDMETSGIMILAFTKEAHRELNRQFEAKEVQKEYVALLDGVLPKMGIAPHGTMELFFRLDVDNRPHQIWDAENGKLAVTEWQILGVERYHAPDGTTRNVTRVLFMPHTGRTHQLRLASSDSHGFGCPIIGDTLYGHCDEGERLMLHAKKISFTHPLTGKRMIFECKPEF